MSYICLLASEDGAVAASDSRLSHTLAKNVLRVRSDRTQKTFYSDGGKVLWAIAGVYKVGFTDLAGKVRRALRNDSLPLQVRLERCRYAMRRATSVR